ncbi:MAG: TetR/AcrR family transcriptional regulator [Thermoactinospora sp.]|nr:TetR/AcrR family transcriptional regulator [Thermoactinospora sp.]
MTSQPLSGRRKQAARNDELILEAARAVFTADPGAPIAAVAERAGVGISALYRRYSSKEELLRKLCYDGLQLYIKSAHDGLAIDDPWDGLAEFLRGVVVYDTNALTIALAGTFQPTEELYHASVQANELTIQLFDRAQQAGVIRSDIIVDDLAALFEQLSSIKFGDDERSAQLRLRYLALALDSIKAPGTIPLPGPPPSREEIEQRWAYKG